MTYQNVDVAGDILQVGTISIDPQGASSLSTTKTLTAIVSAGLPNVASVTTTKLAGRVTLGGAANTILTSSGGVFTLTINNVNVDYPDQCFASVMSTGTTQGTPAIATVTPSSGALVITIVDASPITVAFSGGAFTVNYVIFKN